MDGKAKEALHGLLHTLVDLVPTATSGILPCLKEEFPHRSEPKEIQISVMKNALRLIDTCPALQAGIYECNGQCGPYCTQLQPWRMWTLDCLEHDACCNVTSDDSCWTPLGECGDEYDAAMGDFLKGFAPFSKHCGG